MRSIRIASLAPILVSILASILGFHVAVSPAVAQEGDLTAAERRQRAAALEGELHSLFGEGKYAEAAEVCRKQIALVPEESSPHYNLACALARQGKTAEALASLGRSVELGYEEADHMASDPDLESLRATDGFAALVAKARERRKATAAGLYEPGEAIEGVTTVEAEPEGGFRYRLRLPTAASKEKPARLVVWLHPSGGSMNRVVERLAPRLATKGFGLLVPSQKQWRSWSPAEARKLIEVTLPHAGKRPDVDATAPILLGFSAGGQMAIELWASDPGRFGGIVLDAAYPIDLAAYRQQRMAVRGVPETALVKNVPFFVLVGDQDGGSRIWKLAEESWGKLGVPMTIEYVPGGGHAWLFGEAQVKRLLDWLAAVKAGTVPGRTAEKRAPEDGR